jgi:hypothetical protein
VPDPVQHRLRRPAGDLRQQHRELVAAEPRYHVLRARPVAQHVRGKPQQVVAGLVPGRVVDRLEPVDVEHAERQRQRVAARRARPRRRVAPGAPGG